jgi:glucose/arabinose dehydrogenase/type 1 glutamine amidotransferase
MLCAQWRSNPRAWVGCALAVTLLAASPAAAQEPKPRVLVFHPHPNEHPSVRAGTEALERLADQGGFSLHATQDPAEFTADRLARYRAVVFLNRSGDRLSPSQEAAFQGYIEAGGGFVGIGEAAEAEPGVPFFDGLIGARPSAASSSATTEQTVAVGDRVHPATAHLPLELSRTDVWYQWQTRPTGAVHTVARYHAPDAPAGDGTNVGGTDHPISWCRDFQGGRSFYTGMGRTGASYAEAGFRGHLLGAIQWAGGMVRGNCKATIYSNYQSTRVVSGGPVSTGLATSGESHGVVVAPNGWVIYIGRGDCRIDAERGAVFGGDPIARVFDYASPNAGIGCGPVHVWDPAEYDGTVNSGVTRAGVLAIHGDLGTGAERTNQPNHKIETGLLGIALAPNFMATGHIYLQYFPSFNPNSTPPGLALERRINKMALARVSRFTLDLETKRLDLGSEVRIFEYESQIFSCCHRGGGMGFDSEGNLYVTTGDSNSSQGTSGSSGNNSPPACPTGDPNEASSAHCGDNAISYQDARRTAGSTNDYNGKLLRFKPVASIPDGVQPPVGPGTTYRLPGPGAPNGPNLFDGTEGGGGKTKPEIYAMGLRNPSRLAIDPETDVPYSAWVGPDAGSPNVNLGPSTYESISQLDRAGNYGWPFCMGNKQAYRDRLADGSLRTTNAPGYVSGGPAAGGTDGWYDCNDLVNDSIRNTGLTVLPHTTGTGMDAGTMRPHNLWYSRGNPGGANGCPEFPRERGADAAPNYGAAPRQLCPYAIAAGATVFTGPIYRFDDDAQDSSRRWPEYWDGRWFLHDFGNNSIKHAVLLDPATDQDGGQPVYADSFRGTPVTWTNNYMDSKFGPDGALYVQVYNGFFRANPGVGIFRIDYTGGPDTPGPDPQATPAEGRRITFAIGNSGGVTHRWDFGDGRSATSPTPTHNYTRAGTFDVTLTVTYADGEQASKTIQVVVP